MDVIALSYSYLVATRRDLAALGAILWPWRNCDGTLRCSPRHLLSKGRQHDPSMPEQDVDVLEVLIREVGAAMLIPFSAKRCAYYPRPHRRSAPCDDRVSPARMAKFISKIAHRKCLAAADNA